MDEFVDKFEKKIVLSYEDDDVSMEKIMDILQSTIDEGYYIYSIKSAIGSYEIVFLKLPNK